MEIFSFWAAGEPHPQPRPSVTRTGHTYYRDPEGKLSSWSTAVLHAPLATAAGAQLPYNAPCVVHLRFWVTRPKSHYTAKGALTRNAPTHPCGPRYDVDNLAKLVLDVMQKRGLLANDGLVVGLWIEKSWAVRGGHEPGCHVVATTAESI